MVFLLTIRPTRCSTKLLVQKMADAFQNNENSQNRKQLSQKKSSADDTGNDVIPGAKASRSNQKLANLSHRLANLQRSGKIERAALLDLQGHPLVLSSGMEISPDDGETILRTLASPYNSMTRLKVGKQDFVCFKNTGQSLVGKSEEDFLCVNKGPEFLVVGISDPQSPGSSIYELSRFVAQHVNINSLVDERDNC